MYLRGDAKVLGIVERRRIRAMIAVWLSHSATVLRNTRVYTAYAVALSCASKARR